VEKKEDSQTSGQQRQKRGDNGPNEENGLPGFSV
jgi:hypothetical protein